MDFLRKRFAGWEKQYGKGDFKVVSVDVQRAYGDWAGGQHYTDQWYPTEHVDAHIRQFIAQKTAEKILEFQANDQIQTGAAGRFSDPNLVTVLASSCWLSPFVVKLLNEDLFCLSDAPECASLATGENLHDGFYSPYLNLLLRWRQANIKEREQANAS